MRKFFGGNQGPEGSSNPEPEKQNKWFPACWKTENGSYMGLAKEIGKNKYDFSVQLPDEARKYPESIQLSYGPYHGGGVFQVSFRSGESSWELLKIDEQTDGLKRISSFGAHFGERGIEGRVQFDQINTNKPPVELV